MNQRSNKKRRLGERLVQEFTELRDTLRARKPVEKRFTVRTVELDLQPKQYDAEAVRCVRLSLGVSQAVFAKIMGASVDLVAAWEQGNRVPQPMACRLLESIERDRNRWLEILEHSLSTTAAGRP